MQNLIDSKCHSVRILTNALQGFAESFSFVKKIDEAIHERTQKILEDLSKHLIEIKTSKEWPGTISLWDEVNIYRYKLTPESGFILWDTENKLFNWVYPELPEDLAFYKDGQPIFISTSHEKDAYFSVNSIDEKFLRELDLI